MTDTNNMSKKVEKKLGKKEVKEVEVKEETVQVDGVFEIENGYAIFAGNVNENFIGDKKIAFNEAVKKYKLVKSI